MKVGRKAERTAPVTTSSSRSPRLPSSVASSPSSPARAFAIDRSSSPRGSSVLMPPNRSGAISILSCGGSGASSTAAVPCSRACRSSRSRLAEIRGASSGERQRDPGVADREQPRGALLRVRSGISSPARAGSASPIPAPARTCGTTVHHAEAPRQQREAADAAGDQQAAGDRPGLAGRRGIREAAIAATGSTLTASAAVSGSMLQPETSSSTTRKIDRGQRGREQRQCDRRPQRGSGEVGSVRGGAVRSRRVRAARSATQRRPPGATSGTWARKIARQSKAWSARRRARARRRRRRRRPPPRPARSGAGHAAVEQPEGRDQRRRRRRRAWTPRSTSSRPERVRRARRRARRRRRARSRPRRGGRRRSGARAGAAGSSATRGRRCRRREPARPPRPSRRARPGSRAARG